MLHSQNSVAVWTVMKEYLSKKHTRQSAWLYLHCHPQECWVLGIWFGQSCFNLSLVQLFNSHFPPLSPTLLRYCSIMGHSRHQLSHNKGLRIHPFPSNGSVYVETAWFQHKERGQHNKRVIVSRISALSEWLAYYSFLNTIISLIWKRKEIKAKIMI